MGKSYKVDVEEIGNKYNKKQSSDFRKQRRQKHDNIFLLSVTEKETSTNRKYRGDYYD